MKTICKTVGEAVGCFLVATALGTSAGAQVHVDPQGSFAGQGNSEHPYQLIETAAYVAGQGGALELGPGSYAETLTLSEPMTLSAPNGTATIGRVGAYDVSTFGIYSMNTHLFGDGSDGGVCVCLETAGDWDGERTVALGNYLASQQNLYDVLCLQEVWDQDQRDILASYLDDVWPYNIHYGDYVEGVNCLNSGLWILSKTPISDLGEGNFTEESGLDELATKGWLNLSVQKDGRSIGVFTTHTQAGHGPEKVQDRLSQLNELKEGVDAYRAANPENPIFVCGDFNIAQTSSNCGDSFCLEYYFNFADVFGSEFNDVHPHVREWYDGTMTTHYTAAQFNLLYAFWNADAPSERLDYILYDPGSLGSDYAVVPVTSDIDLGGAVWNGYGESCTYSATFSMVPFLSDHQAVSAQFLIYY